MKKSISFSEKRKKKVLRDKNIKFNLNEMMDENSINEIERVFIFFNPILQAKEFISISIKKEEISLKLILAVQAQMNIL